ncbi:heterodimeric methylmalonyl-CoA mutase small subunit [Lysinibacillus sp. TC-37]|uniref:Methylmalonyl-CoA mutase n=2 Tax=Bacillaceae TaxID=186817 RepID=A0A2I0UVA6_9BACI|nr:MULTISPECIES: methylmalonyl-CoA mutase family protein [Lysinibacillus]KUF34924.1 methylmalonyl-CoA mutase [Lysinibacillus sp. F5]SCZ03227.1 heterodimeric methylmalonyl-CoA mutase small subunit [Lysinibacillus sp. SG9]SDB49507.1 heterodimeric methylmalonyl-CoA mutase small subunit [Lysinibacillus sp. TC-37]SFT14173.1 heterodimeric methylmalonyl-CoA mutase small subunit [Lysinibacillus sp. SG55]PKU49938.1 methylmalonyl-CoA mutase [Lysinibacillus fusiformis]
MSNNMKNIEFEKPAYSDWQDAAIKALKGKPFESLFSKTNEGVTLQPIYTQESLVAKLGEELDLQVATIRSLQNSQAFQVAQQIHADTSEAFFAQLEDSLARGNEVITVDSRVKFDWTEEVLVKLASYFSEYSFKITIKNTKDPLLALFDNIAEDQREAVKGFIVSKDPISFNAFPNVRSVSADTTVYHNEGANAVQELAYALALAAKFAEQEESFEAFSKKFFVIFAIDTQFFTEIAKLRAFKVLWKAFSSAYGVTDSVKIPTVAETSLRSFSKLDVYVNLLRSSNEALSGLIGGADLFTVHPHDVLTKPTEQSIRIARNVSLILKEETNVLKVTDPAGGSYFIESLTADFVKEAWSLFLDIEAAGGMDEYIASGKLAEEVATTYHTRIKAASTRKQSLIGTNIYANPADVLEQDTNPLFADIKRIAVPFEKLRAEMTAANVRTGILALGSLKSSKPRADFVAGFLNTVGLVPEKSEPVATAEEAIAWLQATEAKYVVIAGSDDDTKALVPAILAAQPANVLIDVAGKFKDEEEAWLANGLNGFIFAGQNIIEKLQSVFASMKEVQR